MELDYLLPFVNAMSEAVARNEAHNVFGASGFVGGFRIGPT